MRSHSVNALALMAATALAAAGCGSSGGSSSSQSVAVQFQAVDGSTPVGCGDVLAGLGPDGQSSVEVNDLRFYVSNLRVVTGDGREVAVRLDRNDFQYVSQQGSVALLDLTGTDVGACGGEGVTFPEGTARTTEQVTGTVATRDIAGIRFDVGIPQAVMKKVLADHTAEDAPSPLAEMHWSWAFAYRHLVMNFVVDHAGAPGEGYLHVGSTDCGGDGTRALTDRDECGKINTAQVTLDDFDPDADVVALDLRALLGNLDFTVTTETATVPGVECHSFVQPDCPQIFANLGLDHATGSADADGNAVFWAK